MMFVCSRESLPSIHYMRRAEGHLKVARRQAPKYELVYLASAPKNPAGIYIKLGATSVLETGNPALFQTDKRLSRGPRPTPIHNKKKDKCRSQSSLRSPCGAIGKAARAAAHRLRFAQQHPPRWGYAPAPYATTCFARWLLGDSRPPEPPLLWGEALLPTLNSQGASPLEPY